MSTIDESQTAALLTSLEAQIASRSAVIGVVGLGYVGLPLACVIASQGFRVVGIDRDKKRVRALQSGANPIGGDEPGLTDLLRAVLDGDKLRVTNDYAELADARVLTINVDTPVDLNRQPSYDSLQSATDSVGEVVQAGSLVIVESTVSPGTTLNLVGPVLEKGSNLTIGRDLFLGACPERVMPGKLLANLRNVPRVCGGVTPAVADLMGSFYAAFVDAHLDKTDVTTAELVKVTENTYRDVQVAFANEVSLICEDLGIDVWRVRELVNKVPYRDMHRPGGGVGGHCLPKDPWLLAAAAHSDLHIIPAARLVNDNMPRRIADRVRREVTSWQAQNGHDSRIKVAVLGYTYLADSDDIRNSPSIPLIAELRSSGYQVVVHDPHIAAFNHPIHQVLSDCQVVVVMASHREYEGLALTAPIVLRVGRRE